MQQQRPWWKRSVAVAFGVMLLLSAGTSSQAKAQEARAIIVDAAGETTARDRMAAFSIGSDYSGTLIRDDSLAHLRLVQADRIGISLSESSIMHPRKSVSAAIGWEKAA